MYLSAAIVDMLRSIRSKSRGSSSSSSSYYSGIVTILSVAVYNSINTDTTTCSIDKDTGTSYETGQVITNWSATHSSHPYRVYEPKVSSSSTTLSLSSLPILLSTSYLSILLILLL